MRKVILPILSLIFSVNLMAQQRPYEPPPPSDQGPIPFDIFLVGYNDPKAPPTDPGDAGDLLISKYEIGEEEGVFVITVDVRGETPTISDGRGVELILVGDEQGKVAVPSLGTDRIKLTCGEAIDLIIDSKLVDSEFVISVSESGLTDCQTFKTILANIKPNVIPPREMGTIL